MATGELLLYFVAAPVAAYVVAAAWLRVTMQGIARQQLGFLREPGVNPRFLVFAMIFSVPIVFGLVLLILLLPVPEDLPHTIVSRSLGIGYAITAGLTVLSEAWIIVRRRATSFKENFARALVLAVVPETVVVFYLVFALQVAAILLTTSPGGGIGITPSLSLAGAAALALGCLFMTVGALSAPLSAFLANRGDPHSPNGFRRAVFMSTWGSPIIIVSLILALLQVAQA